MDPQISTVNIEPVTPRENPLPSEIEVPETVRERDPYELTPYMIQYNQKTSMDYTDGYDPKALDEMYKQQKLFDQKSSIMPSEVDFTFDIKYSGINID